LHTHFAERRKTQHREFFEVDPREATEWLQHFARLYPCSPSATTTNEPSSFEVSTEDQAEAISPENTVVHPEKQLSRYIRLWCSHCNARQYTRIAPNSGQAVCPTCDTSIELYPGTEME
jgi:hypothetical protein